MDIVCCASIICEMTTTFGAFRTMHCSKETINSMTMVDGLANGIGNTPGVLLAERNKDKHIKCKLHLICLIYPAYLEFKTMGRRLKANAQTPPIHFAYSCQLL